MKKWAILVILIALSTSFVFAIGEQVEQLIQRDLGTYKYTSSDVDIRNQGGVLKEIMAFYEDSGEGSEVEVKIFEFVNKESVDFYCDACPYDTDEVPELSLEKYGENYVYRAIFKPSNIFYIAAWKNGKYMVFIEKKNFDFKSSDSLLNAYLSKYPSELEQEKSYLIYFILGGGIIVVLIILLILISKSRRKKAERAPSEASESK